jgi:hypothetical protein
MVNYFINVGIIVRRDDGCGAAVKMNDGSG